MQLDDKPDNQLSYEEVGIQMTKIFIAVVFGFAVCTILLHINHYLELIYQQLLKK